MSIFHSEQIHRFDFILMIFELYTAGSNIVTEAVSREHLFELVFGQYFFILLSLQCYYIQTPLYGQIQYQD